MRRSVQARSGSLRMTAVMTTLGHLPLAVRVQSSASSQAARSYT